MSLDEGFAKFHHDNPHIYAALKRIAHRLVATGRRRLSMKMIWEVARHDLMLLTITDDEFKFNNNYTSRYARLLMEREPDLAGVFETRELRTDTSMEATP